MERFSQNMSKNKIYAKSFSLSLILIAGLFSLFITSCAEKPTPAERLYIDTLYLKVKGDLKALNIDPQELQARKDEIVEFMYPVIQDTFPEIKLKLEDDFNGMRAAYDTYLNKYLILESGTKLLLDEVQEFRRATDADELNREEFKSRYKDLDQRINANSKAIEEVAKPVYELEPMWMRLKIKFGKESRPAEITEKQ